MNHQLMELLKTKFVITVAPHKLIWPQGKTYPINAVKIIKNNITTRKIHTKWRGFVYERKYNPRNIWI